MLIIGCRYALQAGCDKTIATIHAIQAMALVHGLWIENRVAGIDEVLGVFHGVIDDVTGEFGG